MAKLWSESKPYENLDPSIFEVDLNKVLRNEGPKEYRDASTFFSVTYFTTDLKDTIKAVDSALNGSGIVIELRSPLGGGKTHTLLTLYHAFKSPDQVILQKNEDDPFGLPKPQNKAIVVALDGRDIPAGGEGSIRTLWGALAKSLGLYEKMKKFDNDMQPPEMNVLDVVLRESGPALIMLDELPAYMEKAMVVTVGSAGQNLARLTIEFIHTLTDSVKGSKSALIFTIPEESYEERSAELERIIRETNYIITRVAEPRTPHSQEDLAGILKKRLFKKVDNEDAKEAAISFTKYYMRVKSGFPSEALEPQFSEQITKCYPFHPSMIKLLIEKITAIPGFQRTRGILRLMTVVVESLRHINLAFGIMPGDIDLSDNKVTNELLRRFPFFKVVINTDIANQDFNARAQKLVKSRPSAVRAATAVFLNSFSLSGKDLASIAPTTKDISLQISKPEDNPFGIEDTIIELSNTSHFMIGEQETRRYFYTVLPNINRMIDDEAARISEVDALVEIRKTVQNKIGTGIFRVVFSWDTIPDDKPEPTLVVLDPAETGMDNSFPGRVEELWNRNSSSFRTYKNALIFIYITPQSKKNLVNIATRLLAISRLNSRGVLFASDKKDNELSKLVEEINRKKLQNEANRVKAELGLDVIRAYSNTIYPSTNEHNQMILSHLSLPITANAKDSIQSTIFELLDITRGAGKLTDSIPPDMMLKDLLKPRWFDNGDNPTGKDVVDTYYSNARLIMPTSESVVIQSIERGIKEYFALKITEDSYVFGQQYYLRGYPNAILVPKEEYDIWKKSKIYPHEAIGDIKTGFSQSFVKPNDTEIKAITKLIEPKDVLPGDKITRVHVSGKDNLEHFLRTEWAILKSKITPKQIRVSLNFSGSNVHLEITNALVDKAPIMKFNTIVNDLTQFSDIEKLETDIMLVDAKKLNSDLATMVKQYPITNLQIERES